MLVYNLKLRIIIDLIYIFVLKFGLNAHFNNAYS